MQPVDAGLQIGVLGKIKLHFTLDNHGTGMQHHDNVQYTVGSKNYKLVFVTNYACQIE